MPVSQVTRSVVAAFLMYRQHPLPHMSRSRQTQWQVFSFSWKDCTQLWHNVTKVNFWLLDHLKKKAFRQNTEFLALWEFAKNKSCNSSATLCQWKTAGQTSCRHHTNIILYKCPNHRAVAQISSSSTPAHCRWWPLNMFLICSFISLRVLSFVSPVTLVCTQKEGWCSTNLPCITMSHID